MNNNNNNSSLVKPSKQKPKKKVNKVKPKQKKRIGNRMSKIEKDYLCCRLDPFNANSGNGIPDTSAGRRFVVDHRITFDCTIGSSGGALMRMVACPSTGLLFKDIASSPTTGLSLNGYSLTGANQGIGNAGGWLAYPNAEWQYWCQTSNPTATTNFSPPFNATQFRFVSQALIVRYTGALTSGAGTIKVIPSFVLAGAPDLNQVAIPTLLVSGAAASTYAVNTVRQMGMSLPTQGVSNMPSGGVITRVTEGAYVLNKRMSPKAEWRDISSRPLVPTDGSEGTSCFAALSGFTYPVIPGFDPDWMSPIVLIQGMTPGTSFQVDMVSCVEYVVDPSSILARLAVDRPTVSSNVLQRADIVVNKMPLAGIPEKMIKLASYIVPPIATLVGGPGAGVTASAITQAMSKIFV